MGAVYPLVALESTDDEAREASVGAVSKTLLGKGRVACLHAAAAFRNRLCGSHCPVAHINCVDILRLFECGKISSSSPPRSPLDFIVLSCSSLQHFAPRLSFIVAVDLIISYGRYHNITLPHEITYTIKMKYQLIALPALAATVAAQDLYVNASNSPQSNLN
jgi:hypothetical protein